eukprot:Pompholyxophrys_punicea_v1_NODE_102_length_3479_cov_3.570386.p4 type:complete len:113 gc:universal NODE_102_length_3479_cov_3.570386:2041-2379(+)
MLNVHDDLRRFYFHARDVLAGEADMTAEARLQIYQHVRMLPMRLTGSLYRSFMVSIDMPVMISVNVNTGDGLCNGTTGIIKAWKYNDDLTRQIQRLRQARQELMINPHLIMI